MNDTLTVEQKATNYDTMTHINRVRDCINTMIFHLLRRAHDHDRTKLSDPEVQLFTEFTPKLATCHYGSQEYLEYLKQLKPALDHHYAQSRHHPEHFKGGIDDMNLIDIIEMFCDWKAATERQRDGNLRKSVEHNADRFGLSPQLVKIFENSMELLDK